MVINLHIVLIRDATPTEHAKYTATFVLTS